ncbi:hypothetical protein [Geomonas sp.]|uniref:hypothetical protein n=1 Tax=Geomonas sp. TaxID=2651584 RepID=UPI002B46BF0C|nr:hypothetical protein [Geomonas sp.]HJV36479.1 hypothetical protein [Geomonas sp.]
MKKVIFATLVFAIAGAATAAQAGVDFSVNIGVPAPAPVVVAPQPVVVPSGYPAPPTLVVEQPPRFIFSPQLGLYLAVDVPYDMAYADGGYYLYNAGYWYYSPSYWGPWSFSGRRQLPVGLRKYRYEQVRHFRDREYRVYLHDRGHYRGNWYNPAPRGPEHMGRRPEHREGWRQEHREHWEDRR